MFILFRTQFPRVNIYFFLFSFLGFICARECAHRGWLQRAHTNRVIVSVCVRWKWFVIYFKLSHTRHHSRIANKINGSAQSLLPVCSHSLCLSSTMGQVAHGVRICTTAQLHRRNNVIYSNSAKIARREIKYIDAVIKEHCWMRRRCQAQIDWRTSVCVRAKVEFINHKIRRNVSECECECFVRVRKFIFSVLFPMPGACVACAAVDLIFCRCCLLVQTWDL